MRILIIRLRALGDVLLTTPAVEAVRRAYPDAELEWVVDDLIAPILEGNLAIDRIHYYPRSRFRRISIARRVVEDAEFTFRIARRDYDLVIDFYGNPRAAWLTFLTGAPRRVGYGRFRGRRAAYTTRFDSTALVGKHSARHHLALARVAGAPTTEAPRPHIHLNAEDRAAARERLGDLACRPFLAIHPGASNIHKRWPPERFIRLLRWARENLDLPSVVLYDPASQGTSRSIAEGAGATFIQDSGVRELAALTAEATVFCGNDSGPMHVAAAVGVPVLAIFGPTLVESWRPLADQSRTVTPPSPGAAASEVQFDDVAGALEELYAEVSPA